MRYYLLVNPGDPDLRPYVLAVIALDKYEGRGPDPDGTSAGSARDALCADGKLLPREQLLVTEAGAQALRDWELGDESKLNEHARRETWVLSLEDTHLLAERGDSQARELVEAGLPCDDVIAFWEDREGAFWRGES